MKLLSINVDSLLGVRASFTLPSSFDGERFARDSGLEEPIVTLNMYRCLPFPIQGICKRVHREHAGFNWSHYRDVSHVAVYMSLCSTFFLRLMHASQPLPDGTPGIIVESYGL